MIVITDRPLARERVADGCSVDPPVAPPAPADAPGAIAAPAAIRSARFPDRDGAETSRQRADRRLLARYAATRDPRDRDAVVARFLPLARQLAASYQRPNEPFDDVFQVACYGLIKA